MQIIQPRGFVTNRTPIFQWETVDGATDYNFKLTDNVTGNVVTEQVVIGTSYEATVPLVYGTYAIQVTTGNTVSPDILPNPNIATEVVIITDTIAQYTIVGREGDVNYTTYKGYQMTIRSQAKQAGQMAANVLSTNGVISDLLTNANDADLGQYHVDTIRQTPGFTADFVELLTKFADIVTIMQRINKRDPQF